MTLRPTPGPHWILLLAVAAILGVSIGSGAAVAGQLIDSSDIANNSVRSLDIKDRTLRGRDVRNGSLTAADFGGSLPSDEPTDIYAWTATFTADGTFGDRETPLLISDDMLPAYAHVQALDLEVVGDFSSCQYAYVGIRPAAQGSWWRGPLSFQTLAEAYYGPSGPAGPDTLILDDKQLRPDGLTPLALFGECDSGDDVTPSFTVTLKFAVTSTDVTGEKAFE